MPKRITHKTPPIKRSPTPTTAPRPGQAMRRGAVEGESYTPDTMLDGVVEVLPKLPPSPPFYLAWHPTRWVVLEGRVVPSLRRVNLQPGVNHVTRNREGRYRVGALRSHLEERGWSLVPYSVGPRGSYMQRVRTGLGPEGSHAHLTTWESAYPGSDQVGSDSAGYAQWCADLVDSGTVPTCPPYIADRLRDRHQSTLAAYEEKIARGSVAYKQAADRLRADIGALDDYVAADLADAAPVKGEPMTVEVE
jgi:hypothetical protein